MPADLHYDSAPGPSHDPAFAIALAALSAMPQRDRNEFLAFLDFWRDLPRESRALFAKAVKPGLTDEQVGRLVGRSGRQLRRWDSYQRLKVTRSRLRGSGRYRGFSDPDDPDA